MIAVHCDNDYAIWNNSKGLWINELWIIAKNETICYSKIVGNITEINN